ncbi:concanavalin A-like lectin/glucanase [Jaminaea rosea]|uniref:Concanavalin A-like lectin/glucanase n=1 Tax=Jaminaea rosea TaxID=1569628 RepID=A0A316UI27_9BASI|nr:concanavalin A-like lectin/glucanase [Jaminaea rosea]PWN24987.1 concanavalin A-like lectin/glucanase [Jaminaea rosea]
MARLRGRAALLLVSILVSVTLLATLTHAAAGDKCSASSQCDSSAPCCSDGGVCGTGALYCAGGCNPLSSHSPTSCQPNPICTSQNITFPPASYNNVSYFRPILQYTGDASKAPLTLDSGSLGKGPEGVLMQMTSQRQVKVSSTRYLFYGDVEARLRHNATQGLVAAFILMSDVKDEIDWESTTSSASDAQSNYFSLGVPKLGNGENVGPSSLDVSQWNTFGLNWQLDRLQWRINGQVVRTLTQRQAGDSYPRSPARVQLSVWAGGNSTEPQGVQDWAGGQIDYTSPAYTANGWYAMELSSLSISCADQSASNVATTGSGSNAITSWVYTGQNDTSGEPTVTLNRNKLTFIKDPGAGGWAGLPGWTDAQTPNTKSGAMWDGSGDTGVDDATSSSGSGGGVFSKEGAVKYGIPIAAGVVGLIIIWAMVMTCVRRKRKAERARQAAAFGAGAAGGAGASKAAGAGYVTAGNVGRGATGSAGGAKYTPLTDEWATHSDDDLPIGAEKRYGGGVGPAAGPTPYVSSIAASDYDYHGGAGSDGWYDEGYGRGNAYPMTATPRSNYAASPAPALAWAQHRHQQQPYSPAYAQGTPLTGQATPQQPQQYGGYGGGWGQAQGQRPVGGQRQQPQARGQYGGGGPGAGYYSYATPGYR